MTTRVSDARNGLRGARGVRRAGIQRILGTAGLLVVTFMLVSGCAGEPVSPSVRPTVATDASTRYKALAIEGIKHLRGVLNASISESGSSFSLVVIVESGTSAARAKDLGDTFIGLVKLAGPDDNPVSELGTGSFDYNIAVLYPNESRVVQGEKLRGAIRIAWQ